MKRAILLGAGFSYQLGMPLAKDFTDDFYSFFNASRIKKYCKMWPKHRPYGDNLNLNTEIFETIRRTFLACRKEKLNYEECLKRIEAIKAKNESEQRSLSYSISKVKGVIFLMFWLYQKHKYNHYIQVSPFYKGFFKLLNENDGTSVITLNHDLFIEFLCIDNGIPLSFGYEKEIVSFPHSNLNRNKALDFYNYTSENLLSDRTDFIKNKKGINLLKLHGGLNEFFYGDESSTLMLMNSVDDCSNSYLIKTKKIWEDIGYYVNKEKLHFGSEIVVSDFKGVMQFLRISLVTGGKKYNPVLKTSKNYNSPGEDKLLIMDNLLVGVDEIVIIGYGFADEHVNVRLQQAMFKNDRLKVFIIDPFFNLDNNPLKAFNYDNRLRRASATAADWFCYLENDNRWDGDSINFLKNIVDKRVADDKKFREKFFK